MNNVMPHNHPAGLRPGWWEDSLASVLLAMQRVFNRMLDDNLDQARRYSVDEQMVQAERLTLSLRDALDQAQHYLEVANRAYQLAPGGQRKSQTLAILTRCTEDYMAISRLISLASGGWTRALNEEMQRQRRVRGEKMAEAIDLPDAGEGRLRWIKLSEELRRTMASLDQTTAEGQHLHQTLYQLVACHGAPPQNSTTA